MAEEIAIGYASFSRRTPDGLMEECTLVLLPGSHIRLSGDWDLFHEPFPIRWQTPLIKPYVSERSRPPHQPCPESIRPLRSGEIALMPRARAKEGD